MATSAPPSNPVPLANTLDTSDTSNTNADSNTGTKIPNTFDATSDFSTTRLGYLKLYALANLMRTTSAIGKGIAIWTGRAERPMPPHDYFLVPSSKGEANGKGRRIRVNVYRNEAAKKDLDRPSAVHFNWHGKFDFITFPHHSITLSVTTSTSVTFRG